MYIYSNSATTSRRVRRSTFSLMRPINRYPANRRQQCNIYIYRFLWRIVNIYIFAFQRRKPSLVPILSDPYASFACAEVYDGEYIYMYIYVYSSTRSLRQKERRVRAIQDIHLTFTPGTKTSRKMFNYIRFLCWFVAK